MRTHEDALGIRHVLIATADADVQVERVDVYVNEKGDDTTVKVTFHSDGTIEREVQ